MMKKTVLWSMFLCLLVFCGNEHTYAQFSARFKFSTGFTTHILQQRGAISTAYGVALTPQYNLWELGTDFSFSLNFPMNFGVHIENDFIPQTFYFSQLPATIELNLAHLATKDFRGWVGVFAGGGYSLQFRGNKLQGGGLVSGGFRTWIFKRSFTLRYGRFFNSDKTDIYTHSITLTMNIGKWVKKVRTMNKISNFMKPIRKK